MPGLHFGAGIDTRQWSRDVEKMRRDILSMTKEGESVDLRGLKQQISIQKQAVKELEQQYKQASKAMDKAPFGNARDAFVVEQRKIATALEAEKKALSDLEETYQSFGGEQVKLRTRQLELRDALGQLALAGKENTEEFRRLSDELHNLEKGTDSIRAMQNALRRGSPALTAFTGALRAGTGIFTGFTGAMGLFNAQSERFAELQTRLQSVMSISIGVEQTYHSLIREGSLLQSVQILQSRAMAKSRELETRGTISATIAHKALNVVAKANPYVLLATAVISVIGALALFSRANKEAQKTQEAMNKAVAEGSAGDIARFGLLRAEWERAGQSLDKRNKVVEKFNEQLGDTAGRIKGVNDAEQVFSGRGTADFITAMERRAKAEFLLERSSELWKEYRKAQEEAVKIAEAMASGNMLRQGIATGQALWGAITGDSINGRADRAHKAFEDNLKEILKAQNEMDEAFAKLRLDRTEGETASFRQQLDDRLNLWKAYYDAVRVLGKDAADSIFEGDFKAPDYIGELTARQEELRKEIEATNEPTKEQAENLALLTDRINELLNIKSPFELQKEQVLAQTDAIDSLTDRISFLRQKQDELGNSIIELELGKDYQTQIEKYEKERKDLFDRLINQRVSYERRLEQIEAESKDMFALATTADERKTVEESAGKKRLEAYIQMLKDTHKDLDKVFSDINSLTREQLREFRKVFEIELGATDDIARKNEIDKIIAKIDRELRKLDANPFKEINQALKDLAGGGDGDALERLGLASREVARTFNSAVKDITSTAQKLGVDLNSEFMQILQQVEEVTAGLEQVGQGATEIGAGIETGNPLLIISGTVKAVGGLVDVIRGLDGRNKRINRQITEQTKGLQKLTVAYNDLQASVNRMLTGDALNAQKELVANLREQQQALKAMLTLEQSRRRKDRDDKAITDLKEQIADIDRQVNDLIDSVANELLGTTVQDLAGQMGDALVDAFSRGADSAKALDDVVNNVFKNMVRNLVASRLEPQIQSIFDSMLRDMGFDPLTGAVKGGLTAAQMDRYRNLLRELGKQGEDILKGFEGLFEAGRPDALRGAIQGMSQQTADVLAGQFNAIRMDTAVIVRIMQDRQSNIDAQLLYLSGINNNTLGIYTVIKDLNSKISASDLRSTGL